MMIDPITQQHFDLGLDAITRKAWPAAADAFWAACRRAPNNSHILFNLANARLQAGDYKGCRWAIDRALTLDPAFRNLQLLAGNLCVETGDFKTAVDHYVAAIQHDPQNAIISTNMAAAFEQLKLFEEAYECYEFAITLGGDRAALYSGMFYVASHACRWDLAEVAQRALGDHLAHGGQNSAAPFQTLCMQSTRAQQLEAAQYYARANFTETPLAP